MPQPHHTTDDRFGFEDMLLNYNPNENGELAQYITDEWGVEQFEQLAAALEDEDGDSQPDKETDAISESVLAGD